MALVVERRRVLTGLLEGLGELGVVKDGKAIEEVLLTLLGTCKFPRIERSVSGAGCQ